MYAIRTEYSLESWIFMDIAHVSALFEKKSVYTKFLIKFRDFTAYTPFNTSLLQTYNDNNKTSMNTYIWMNSYRMRKYIIHDYTHTYLHAYFHTKKQRHTYLHIFIHINTNIWIYINKVTHTYTYSYMQRRLLINIF